MSIGQGSKIEEFALRATGQDLRFNRIMSGSSGEPPISLLICHSYPLRRSLAGRSQGHCLRSAEIRGLRKWAYRALVEAMSAGPPAVISDIPANVFREVLPSR